MYYTNTDMFDHPTWCIYYLGHHTISTGAITIPQKLCKSGGTRVACGSFVAYVFLQRDSYHAETGAGALFVSVP